MSRLIPIKLRVPEDVLTDIDAVCPPRGRTAFVVDAIRAKLATEPAALRAQGEREAAARVAEFRAKREFERRVEEARAFAPSLVAGLGTDEARLEEWIETSGADMLLVREVLRIAQERRAAENTGD